MKKLLSLSAMALALALVSNANAMDKGKAPPAHNHHEHAYVEFPPKNEEGNIMYHPEFYMSDQSRPYVYHGGYWWYPHADATMVEGYMPIMHEGYYWYASEVGPDVFYGSNAGPVVFVVPHPMDKPMDDAIGSPMEKDHVHAPGVKPAE